jgi:hypothetical protein
MVLLQIGDLALLLPMWSIAGMVFVGNGIGMCTTLALNVSLFVNR